jgi:diacylglycerol O-acyltransferase / wax synthase
VNDVLLAIIAGGVQGLLRSRGEPVEGVILPIYVPVSLRRDRSGRAGGNLISQMVVAPSSRDRRSWPEAAAASQGDRQTKAIDRPSLGTMFHSKVIRGAMLKLIIRQRVNVVSADLPGPQTPLHFAGAQLIELFPLLNLLGTESLGVGALSYAGQFNVMVIADADAYPDIDVFVAFARDELRGLTESTTHIRG